MKNNDNYNRVFVDFDEFKEEIKDVDANSTWIPEINSSVLTLKSFEEIESPEIAQELADLIKPRNKLSYVNLIPYNPVAEHIKYERSTRNDTAKFYDVLKKNGINCVVRQEHGTDIDAACGQLRSKQIRKNKEK